MEPVALSCTPYTLIPYAVDSALVLNSTCYLNRSNTTIELLHNVVKNITLAEKTISTGVLPLNFTPYYEKANHMHPINIF